MANRTAPIEGTRPLLSVDPETGALRERSYTLTVASGPDQGREVVLTAPLTVGTHPSAGLVLSDGTVSRFHAELRPSPLGLQVKDLDSRNGTFLGEARVREAVIERSALLKVGQTALRVTLQEHAVAVGEAPRQLGEAITRTAAMARVLGLLEQVAKSDSSVLLLGETGVGKEVLARAVHQVSERSERRFVVVDCGALAASVVESELFGHVKGAFTGAEQARSGAFVEARGGTLFLDEIGELPLELQPKLLRALDSRSVKPLGSDDFVEVDVRIVAATHRDLRAEVAAGRFREDLYFRLAVVPVRVPPLRERLADLPALIERFAGADLALTAEVSTLFEGYRWPGNVRELRNVVERALAGSSLEAPVAERVAPAGAAASSSEGALDLPFKEAKRQLTDTFTRAYLENLLARCEGNVSKMARTAGVARHYLRELLQRYGLHGAGDEEE
ncbi:MAG: sigma 54-dependent Fis family transcriptional regulator [Archangiaceae bacterium]|nr:sigma 54-dependent Fis family transcriptional regulator [Archangiaceae bacterium]